MPVFFDVPDTHRALVLDLLQRSRDFLKLKGDNSVHLMLTCDLDPMHGQPDHAHPSPIVVRARIANVQAGQLAPDNPYCDFRIASAEAGDEAPCTSFDQVHKSILDFFDTQFHAALWHHILTMRASVIMSEPLGVLAVMEGTSNFGAREHTLCDRAVLHFATDDNN